VSEPETGLERISKMPYQRGASGRGATGHMIAAGASPSVASPLPLRRLSVTGRLPAPPKEGGRAARRASGEGGEGGEGGAARGRRGAGRRNKKGKGGEPGDIELPV
jgi:hypothetical protein